MLLDSGIPVGLSSDGMQTPGPGALQRAGSTSVHGQYS